MARSSNGIFVSHIKYVLDLLEECGMLGCKLPDTPMEATTKLEKGEKGALVDKDLYQKLVGRLIYLSHTILDI